jgi:uncharacterized protein YjiS (DUF1127 family)
MFKRLVKAIQNHQQLRTEYRQLNNLSDFMLKDIGVNRGEIKHRFYKKEEDGC